VKPRIFQTGQGRIWLQRFGPRPEHRYEYLGCSGAGGVGAEDGEVAVLSCPTGNDEFRDTDTVGPRGNNPTASSLRGRLGLVNRLMSLRCPFDIQVLYGQCGSPGDRVRGWEKIRHLYSNRITGRSGSDLTAMVPGDRAAPLVTADLSAKRAWEIDPLRFAEVAAGDVTTEIVAIVVCPECDDCEGCRHIYAIAKTPAAGSPGILPEVIWTEDGGVTWSNQYIDTLGASENPSGAACIGGKLVVISHDSCSLHWASLDDLDTWTEVTTGFVAGGCPNAIYSADASHTWIVGDGGYVYFTSDPMMGVEVQDPGLATTQDMTALHFCSLTDGVAVGDNNAVLVTKNGQTWQSLTGPATGLNLVTAWAVNPATWWVGTDATVGLYYTLDGGQSWKAKAFAESGQAGTVQQVVFSEDPAVGYMLVNPVIMPPPLDPCAYVAAVLTDGPVLYWRLDELSGVIAADRSGNGLTGTYSLADLGQAHPFTGCSGNVGIHLAGGTWTVNVRGAVPVPAQIQFGTGAFSVEFWAYGHTTSNTNWPINCWSAADVGWGVQVVHTIPVFRFYTYHGGAGHGLAGSLFVTGQWYHYVLTRDASGNKNIYRNGLLDAGPSSDGGIDVTQATAALSLSGMQNSNILSYHGLFDEVALYDYELSAVQIAAHYAAR